MKIKRLDQIKPLLFSAKDLAEVFGISQASAKLACHRYAREEIMVRLKRDLYILTENWKKLEEDGKFRVANRLQVPSYISFTTALAHYGITTQIPRGFYESTALLRTARFEIKEAVFRYRKFQKKLYFGFIKKENYFIATPEKALCDALYLASFYRYRLDVGAIDFRKINSKEFGKMNKFFPKKTRDAVRKIWKF